MKVIDPTGGKMDIWINIQKEKRDKFRRERWKIIQNLKNKKKEIKNY